MVLPSYNGARKLPVLTPLLALLLAREGLPVVVHGTPTESSRVLSQEVFQALGIAPRTGSGLGTTAASPTAGCSISALSSSNGLMR